MPTTGDPDLTLALVFLPSEPLSPLITILSYKHLILTGYSPGEFLEVNINEKDVCSCRALNFGDIGLSIKTCL